MNSGYLPHGISLIDARTHKVIQSVPLKTTWLGLAWAADGKSFWYTRYPTGGPAEDQHFYQHVYYHTIGTPASRNLRAHSGSEAMNTGMALTNATPASRQAWA